MTETSPDSTFALRMLEDYVRLHPQEAAVEAEKQDAGQLVILLAELPERSAGMLFERLVPAAMERAYERMELEVAGRIFRNADPARLAVGLSRLKPERVEELIAAAPQGVAREMRDSMAYEPDSAGRLMDPKVAEFRETDTAGESLDRIRSRRMRRIHEVYVVDDRGILTGVVPIHELALAETDTALRELATRPRGSVQAMAPREEVVDLFEQKKLSGIPVVDHEHKLLGVIRYEALIGAAQDEALEDIQAMVGVSRDEKALSPALFAVRKRLPWLQINLLTAFLAAAVVGMFEATIAKVTALAVLLPVVAGQSGNTGAQALAVAIRGLTVREIRTRHWPRLVRKEFTAGVLNGVAVALVTGIGVYVWSQSVGLVLVIAVSMVLSMGIAGVAGAAVPLTLKALNQDPAQSSSIILTTVTDVFGFFSFLGIATLLMEMLPQG